MTKTASQEWNEQISQHRRKCQQILTISKSIRYVGLINEYGRTLTGIIKPGTDLLLGPEPARNEFFLISTIFSMRKKIGSSIGKMDYAIFRHDKVTLLLFQREEGTYYMSLSRTVTSNVITKIITKIKKII